MVASQHQSQNICLQSARAQLNLSRVTRLLLHSRPLGVNLNCLVQPLQGLLGGLHPFEREISQNFRMSILLESKAWTKKLTNPAQQ